MTELLTEFTLQLAVILLVAKIFGEIFERMGQSSVLGELIAGMVIGPYALGSLNLPFFGKLFPIAEQVGGHAATLPVSPELYVFAQIGAVILLFLVGLETNAKMFMKYGVKALGVALGGVLLPFFLGAWGTVMFGFADTLFSPTALFMGAIMTATSVGITARVLSDIFKLDTSEGVTVLAAAVMDDVLGILVLALVLSLNATGGNVSWGELGLIGLKAVGFMGAVVILGILFAKKLSRMLLKLQGKTYLAVAVALCFLIAALAEEFGLAMIIGAYLTGIILSVTELRHQLEEKLVWVSHVIVPIFFAVMGMLVDFKAMMAAVTFGLVITLFAIIGKVVGCGLPALFSGFNFLGASRIGFGMLPRGEVALIVAGVGLAAGVINQEVFGVSIMMTIITTLMAPLILVPLFKINKSGLRSAPVDQPSAQTVVEPYFNWDNAENALDLFQENLSVALQEAGYNLLRSEGEDRIMEFANSADPAKIISVRRQDKQLFMDCSKPAVPDAKLAITAGQNRSVSLVSGFVS
ncbi:MAG: cation:proton antiporter [Candidatus Komeilibacteria bacterium]|nr:cation:proton antiporter [Candidatus Komeilibacteria bacterium]